MNRALFFYLQLFRLAHGLRLPNEQILIHGTENDGKIPHGQYDQFFHVEKHPVKGKKVEILAPAISHHFSNKFKGFNPSIVHAPTEWQKLKENRVKFVMSTKLGDNQCHDFQYKCAGGDDPEVCDFLASEFEWGHGGSAIYILDGKFKVLRQIAKLRELDDARLFVFNETLWLSGRALEGSEKYSKDIIGQLQLWKPVAGEMEVNFDTSKFPGYISINAGIIQDDNGQMSYIESLDPLQEQPLDKEPEKNKLHNSIHPLHLPRLKAYLLAGHTHWDFQPARYGASYTQQILLMTDKAPHQIIGSTKDFCIQARDGRDDCESIQFIMSMALVSPNVNISDAEDQEIYISYGINDCQSALASFKLKHILSMMWDLRVPVGINAINLLP